MDPELQTLIVKELKTLETQQNELFNSGLTEEEKENHANGMEAYGKFLLGIMEFLPALKAHLQKKGLK